MTSIVLAQHSKSAACSSQHNKTAAIAQAYRPMPSTPAVQQQQRSTGRKLAARTSALSSSRATARTHAMTQAQDRINCVDSKSTHAPRACYSRCSAHQWTRVRARAKTRRTRLRSIMPPRRQAGMRGDALGTAQQTSSTWLHAPPMWPSVHAPLCVEAVAVPALSALFTRACAVWLRPSHLRARGGAGRVSSACA